MENLNQIIQNRFSIYCAGEFSSLLVQYCAKKGCYDNIEAIIVSKRDAYVPAHILGIQVIELNDYNIGKKLPIVIAILSSSTGKDIKEMLLNNGYVDTIVLHSDIFRSLYKYLNDFSVDIKSELKKMSVKTDLNTLRLEKKIDQLSMQINSMPMIADIHNKSFGEFKDIYRGRTIVVCGAGATFGNYKHCKEYIHIGCNSIGFIEDFNLDYYFLQHIPADSSLFCSDSEFINVEMRRRYLECLDKLDCVKFVGQGIGDEWAISPPI